ncbi:MAG TPA: hypothetical protein VGN97_15080 [Mesorhizobium sp.]|nr:hypothetical protein [Mesorhizobium sp.]
MPDSTTVDLSFLAKQVQSLIEESRGLRQDVREVRTLTLPTLEYLRRVERRQTELRDDLETIIKIELGGASANLQTGIEASIGRIESSVEDLANRIAALEHAP